MVITSALFEDELLLLELELDDELFELLFGSISKMAKTAWCLSLLSELLDELFEADDDELLDELLDEELFEADDELSIAAGVWAKMP